MFTAQELIYLALGQRRLAQDALKDAENQPALATKEALLTAAKAYGELAAKCDRLASSAAQPGRPRGLPSYPPAQTGVDPSSHSPGIALSRRPRR